MHVCMPVCVRVANVGERKRRDHDRNIKREAASPTVSDCPSPSTAATRDINHWITKPCLIASCISVHTVAKRGEETHYFSLLDAGPGAPHLDSTSPPCRCTPGTKRNVTRKNGLCSHLLINIALPLLLYH